MRIIGGSCRGRTIRAPKGAATRPTQARVKESLFGILQFRVPSAVVLDLYAGSGNLGLEALSRGAAHAVFNDSSRACCALVKENLRALGLQDRAAVYCGDANTTLERLHAAATVFDIAFLDPPYKAGAQAALQALFSLHLMKKEGVAVVEHMWGEPIETLPDGVALLDRRKYGDTGLSFYGWAEGGAPIWQ